MIRRLWLLSAALMTLVGSPAFGLGLGELQLNSALNQTFDAEIRLTNVRGLSADEILANLASQNDFDRVGVERNYQLLDLRFKVVQKDDGYYVRVTSTKPIIEPYVNFIVEVLWPSGRILREYTVLLDPPVFGQQGIAPVQLSAAQPAARASQPPSQRAAPGAPGTGSPARPGTDTQARATQPAPSRGAMAEGEVYDGEYGVTGPGDTLWNIALKVRPDSSVTVQQVMLALQRANPEAFINRNINLLKAGHVLRIPDVAEIAETSNGTAVRQVRTQNQAFSQYRAGGLAQMDATERRSDRTSARPSEDGELRLLSGSDEQRSDGGPADPALANELAVTKEDLDRARRSNAELNLKLDDIRAQNETLSEIVQQKEDRLALLQAQVAKLQQAVQAGVDGGGAERAPAPVAPGGGSILTNPMFLGGGALLLVLLAAVGLFALRRQRADRADDDFGSVQTAAVEAAPLALADLEPEAQDAGDARDRAEEEEDFSPQTSDVISEAEIYIAYGRFPQAITFLQNASQAEPERADVQLKLMEVYVQTEDATAFNLQFERFGEIATGAEMVEARALQSRIPGAAEAASAAMDATIISSEPIEAIAGGDDDLSFDLDDLDSETADEELDLSDDLDLELTGDEELEFNLDDENAGTVILDSAIEEPTGDSDLDLGDDDLDLDLDLEFDDAEEDSVDLDSLDDGLSDDTLNLDDEISLSDDDLDIELDLDGSDTIDLDDAGPGAGDSPETDLPETLNLDADGALDLDADETLQLDDGEIELDLDEGLDLDDGFELDDDGNLDLDGGLDLDDDLKLNDTLDLDDDLDLDDELDLDDDLALEAGEGDDALAGSLDVGDTLAPDADSELVLDDDGAISLDLDDEIDLNELGDLDIEADADDGESFSLDADADFDLDNELSGDLDLDLEDDDATLELDDDGAFSLDLDDDEVELDLEEEANNKLDLARAYIDMGDADSARSVLQQVLAEGSEAEIQEAGELLEKID